MKTSANTKVTATVGTVKITYSEAQTIRCVAKADMPAYGIREGEAFYLVRSSKDNGEYYIVRFDADAARWQCRCPSRKPCRHEKLVNAAIVARCQVARQREQAEAVAIENCNAYARYSAGYADIAC